MAKDSDETSVNLINLSGFGQVRLGRGLIGKTSLAVMAAIAAFGAIGVTMSGSHYLQFLICIIILALIGAYLAACFWYAGKNPEAVLLEGAELLQWRQMEMAAKNLPSNLPDNNVAPPREIESKSEEVT